jgi:integration host factor subunit alpha
MALAKTLTRADLADAVFGKVGLARNEAAEIVELVLKQIVYALERGEPIKLSSFGSFGLRQKSERIGRNPKTGEVVPITPRRVIVFKASNIMKDKINAGLAKPAKPEKAAKAEKAAKPDKADKAAKADKIDKADKGAKVEKAVKPEKGEKAAKPVKTAKPVKAPPAKKRAGSSG